MATFLFLLFAIVGGILTAGAGTGAVLFWWRLRSVRAQLQAAEARSLEDRSARDLENTALRTSLTEATDALAVERASRAALEAEQSDWRALELALRESQEAFLSRMSHELRTPLNAVVGYTELLLEEASEHRADLERIRVASANLDALVTSVLDLSELQSGDFAMRPEAMRLEELVRRAVDASRFSADQQANQIEVLVEPELAVCLDRRMMSSILFHLVSNACKFTMKGRVTIQARSAQPNLGGLPTDGLEIRVSDTGIGMTERQIQAAFQPFSQADASATRRYDGGGVGLAVVNGFVRAMGGEVSVSSTPGAGATVTLLLPKQGRYRDEGLGDDEDTMLLR